MKINSSAGRAYGRVKLADIFQDNMVLQRDMPIPVWGWAPPGEKITVRFAGQTAVARAGSYGRWTATLAPLKACAEPAKLIVEGAGGTMADNVLVGEVWLASGQSNMAMQLCSSMRGADDIASADFPGIREFGVERNWELEPVQDIRGDWTSCTPRTAGCFSAAAYYFARELHVRLDVPIGIIHSSWGGSSAETWTPLETLKARAGLHKELLEVRDRFAGMSKEEILDQRFKAEMAQRHKDTGNECEARGWALPGADMADWLDIRVPSYLETVFGDVDGAYWFRREIELPAGWADTDLTLMLGAVDDLDTTYFNGVRIGATGFEVPEWWSYQRVYKVPAGLVKAGGNTLAVRVFDERHAGGLAGPELKLIRTGAEPIDLAGTWKIREERRLAPLPEPSYPHYASMQHIPAYLFNGMIAPLVPFAFRGVIWYQGENNVARHKSYRALFGDLIAAWRNVWGRGDFPFYFVQLPNYQARKGDPSESDWAELREAQRQTLSLPRTRMAVTIDIGDEHDLHPPNKHDVGRRLALIALSDTYGQNITASGPLYRAMTVENGSIRLTFDNASGLKAVGGALKGFAICGADGKFVWADARIEGEQVVVSAAGISEPAAVRYAWADNPDCNLYNGAGLPASPFQADINSSNYSPRSA